MVNNYVDLTIGILSVVSAMADVLGEQEHVPCDEIDDAVCDVEIVSEEVID